MVLEEKNPNLLTLLTPHDGGNALVVPVVPRPPTPLFLLQLKLQWRKRKKGKATGKKSSEEGEIPPTTQQPPLKEPKLTRAEQNKGPSEGASKDAEGEQCTKAVIWNSAFVHRWPPHIWTNPEGCLEGKVRVNLWASWTSSAPPLWHVGAKGHEEAWGVPLLQRGLS